MGLIYIKFYLVQLSIFDEIQSTELIETCRYRSALTMSPLSKTISSRWWFHVRRIINVFVGNSCLHFLSRIKLIDYNLAFLWLLILAASCNFRMKWGSAQTKKWRIWIYALAQKVYFTHVSLLLLGEWNTQCCRQRYLQLICGTVPEGYSANVKCVITK